MGGWAQPLKAEEGCVLSPIRWSTETQPIDSAEESLYKFATDSEWARAWGKYFSDAKALLAYARIINTVGC